MGRGPAPQYLKHIEICQVGRIQMHSKTKMPGTRPELEKQYSTEQLELPQYTGPALTVCPVTGAYTEQFVLFTRELIQKRKGPSNISLNASKTGELIKQSRNSTTLSCRQYKGHSN